MGHCYPHVPPRNNIYEQFIGFNFHQSGTLPPHITLRVTLDPGEDLKVKINW
jgi:hypothetical protein